MNMREVYLAAARAYCRHQFNYDPAAYVDGPRGAAAHLDTDAVSYVDDPHDSDVWLKLVVDAVVTALVEGMTMNSEREPAAALKARTEWEQETVGFLLAQRIHERLQPVATSIYAPEHEWLAMPTEPGWWWWQLGTAKDTNEIIIEGRNRRTRTRLPGLEVGPTILAFADGLACDIELPHVTDRSDLNRVLATLTAFGALPPERN